MSDIPQIPGILGRGILNAEPLIQRILDDEGLTGDLLESEAEKLNLWLIDHAKKLAMHHRTIVEASRDLDALCRRATSVGKVMAAWRDKGDPATLAKAAGLQWQPAKSEAETFASLLKQLG